MENKLRVFDKIQYHISTEYSISMLHGHDNIEMDTIRGYMTNSLKYTRHVCPIQVSDAFRTRSGFMIGVPMLHLYHLLLKR